MSNNDSLNISDVSDKTRQIHKIHKYTKDKYTKANHYKCISFSKIIQNTVSLMVRNMISPAMYITAYNMAEQI